MIGYLKQMCAFLATFMHWLRLCNPFLFWGNGTFMIWLPFVSIFIIQESDATICMSRWLIWTETKVTSSRSQRSTRLAAVYNWPVRVWQKEISASLYYTCLCLNSYQCYHCLDNIVFIMVAFNQSYLRLSEWSFGTHSTYHVINL
jgi:hypothetical protein